MITSLFVLLRRRKVSDKKFERKSKYIFCSKRFFFENRAFSEIMWENIVQPDRR
jgi:hypothetical protein